MNVSIFIQMAYENKSNWTLGQNKPNSNPIKPNLRKAKMDVNIYYTKVYENISNWTLGENKPKTNPNKACPERIEFTLSVIEGNGPILERMNVSFCAAGYYERKSSFTIREGRPNSQDAEFTTAGSCGARIVTPAG